MWPENILCYFVWILFFFLNLRCVFWLRMWSILVNFLCEFEKNVYSVLLDRNSINVDAIKWLIVLFWSTVSLLIFCLLDVSITDIGVLKTLTVTVDLSIFFFSFNQFCILFWFSLIMGIHICDRYVFLENWTLCHYVMIFFILENILCSEIWFTWN